MSATSNITTLPPATEAAVSFPCSWPTDGHYPIQHVMFQLANLFLFISLVGPPGLLGVLYLRVCLFLGFMFFLLWGSTIMCLLDVVLWNLGNTLLNLVQVGILIYKLRPVQVRADLNLLYAKVFCTGSMSAAQFRACYNLKSCEVHKSVKPGYAYATAGKTKTDTLGILLKGSMEVSYRSRTLHIITPYTFIDSPEYMAFSADDVFQVNITCREECEYISWSRPDLAQLFAKDAILGSIFEHVMGRDVALKLFTRNREHRNVASVRGSNTDLDKFGYLERTEYQMNAGNQHVIMADSDAAAARIASLDEVTEMIDNEDEDDEDVEQGRRSGRGGANHPTEETHALLDNGKATGGGGGLDKRRRKSSADSGKGKSAAAQAESNM